MITVIIIASCALAASLITILYRTFNKYIQDKNILLAKLLKQEEEIHTLRTSNITTNDQLYFITNSHLKEIEKLENEHNQKIKDMLANYNSASGQITQLKIQNDNIQKKLEEEIAKRNKFITEARKDAVKKAETISHGFASENFAPLLMEYYSKDFRHQGDPIDFIIYDGMDEVRQGTAKDLKKIIFIDIKTGQSQLSTIQRRIRDAITEGRVEFHIFNADTKEIKVWKM